MTDYEEKDAFPKRVRPCAGRFLKNGDFITVSGRYVQGPLCALCGGLVNGNVCLACSARQ